MEAEAFGAVELGLATGPTGLDEPGDEALGAGALLAEAAGAGTVAFDESTDSFAIGRVDGALVAFGVGFGAISFKSRVIVTTNAPAPTLSNSIAATSSVLPPRLAPAGATGAVTTSAGSR